MPDFINLSWVCRKIILTKQYIVNPGADHTHNHCPKSVVIDIVLADTKFPGIFSSDKVANQDGCSQNQPIPTDLKISKRDDWVNNYPACECWNKNEKSQQADKNN